LRENGRDPCEYKIGDRILDFFSERKLNGQTPTDLSELDASVRSAKEDIISSYEKLFRVFPDYIRTRTEFVLKLAKARKDYILAMHQQPAQSKENAKSEEPSTSSGAEACNPTAPESRKTRLEGVDVSALPAGFGKRRVSNAAGGMVKKPKTPEGMAPTLAPASNDPSRSSSPALT
jgi:hypothetical protein